MGASMTRSDTAATTCVGKPNAASVDLEPQEGPSADMDGRSGITDISVGGPDDSWLDNRRADDGILKPQKCTGCGKAVLDDWKEQVKQRKTKNRHSGCLEKPNHQ